MSLCVCVCVCTYSLLLLVGVDDYHVEQSKFDKLLGFGLAFWPHFLSQWMENFVS